MKNENSTDQLTLIVGLGYVGLPLAKAAVEVGLAVEGYDTNPDVVNRLNAGESHIDDISNDEVQQMIDKGFIASTDESVIRRATNIIICVPTPLGEGGGPDLRAVKGAALSVSRFLQDGSLVVLESTTYPGTTEDVLVPILNESGLTAGRDFSVAFSPERVDPGNRQYGIRNTPKVVGGIDHQSTLEASKFYDQFIDTVVTVKGPREAELSKLLENTYRHVNIALVNEMAKFCDDLDIDIWEVIRAASTKPYGFKPFYPGPGVGGHCIPIDPNYLSYSVKKNLGYPFRFVELAQEINAGMPRYVVSRVQDMLNEVGQSVKGSTVLLLGVTYKANISDERESPSIEIGRVLADKGATVKYFDPFVPEWTRGPGSALAAPEYLAESEKADLTLLLQPHDFYDNNALSSRAKLILDTTGRLEECRSVRTL